MNIEAKIQKSKEILQLASDMSLHYYGKPIIICYSGGKDSDVILRLAMEALKPDEFEVLHSITTIDSPITNRYVNDIFEELKEKGIKCSKSIPIGKDGQPTNMWKLIPEKKMPPTRIVRYCCQVLKETKTPNRVAILGVRADESTKRKGRDIFGVRGGLYSQATFFSLDHTAEVHREALEHENELHGEVWDCTLIKAMRENNDTVVNPIYEWSDSDVWTYLNRGGTSTILCMIWVISGLVVLVVPWQHIDKNLKSLRTFQHTKIYISRLLMKCLRQNLIIKENGKQVKMSLIGG